MTTDPNPITPFFLRLTDGAIHIDNSSLEKYTTCPRSAQYYIFQKLQRSGTRSALEFGKIIHKALELRYRQASVMPMAQIEALQMELLGDEFTRYTPPEDEYRNYQFAVEVILQYNQHYPIEDFEPIVSPDGQQMVEVPFAIPLGIVMVPQLIAYEDTDTQTKEVTKGTFKPGSVVPVIWTGKIDLAYARQGQNYLMDHKTTSVLGEGFYKDFELSHATHGYTFALERLLDRPIHGYVINALATRKPTRTGRSIEFERKSVVVSPELLNEWHEDTLYIIQTMVTQACEGYFPKHTKWCVGKYGTCEYHMVCNMPPASRPVVLSSGEFKPVTWTPHSE